VPASQIQITKSIDEVISFERASVDVLPKSPRRLGALAWASIGLVAIAALLAAAYAWQWGWIGLIASSGRPKHDLEPGEARLLWDWLDLLVVPAILAVGAWYLNRAEASRRLREEASRSMQERTVAEQRDHRDVASSYVEVMTGRLSSPQPCGETRELTYEAFSAPVLVRGLNAVGLE
jgi:hypothetical protein